MRAASATIGARHQNENGDMAIGDMAMGYSALVSVNFPNSFHKFSTKLGMPSKTPRETVRCFHK